MICYLLSPECWPMRTEWLRSYLPDSLTRGAGRSLWVQTDILQYQLTKRLRTRRFAAEKWMPCILWLITFGILPSISMFSKCPLLRSLKRVEGFEWRDRPFSGKPSTFFLWVQSFLHFSMSSPYSSKWRRTMFSTKLERFHLPHPKAMKNLCLLSLLEILT